MAAVGVVQLGTVMGAPVSAAPPEAPPEVGHYIVVLQDNVADPGAVGRQHASEHGAKVGFVYRDALKGYSATLPPQRLAALAADPRVKYVEPDQEATVSAQTLPWGVNKVEADVSSTLAGNGSGTVAANVYVIDTGIDTAHTDLTVAGHVNFTSGSNRDCNGHGTHVAGSAAAKDNTASVVGVAPGAQLYGVKVLGCNGSGSYSAIIKGVDWVTANKKASAVANMSLGGPTSQALDDAVRRSAASGVAYVIAAGNEGQNACNSSPGRAGAGTSNGIITVGATDSSDREASFSNYGSCVDIWAPGVGITSTRNGGGTTTMSGTSMASPHVAGGAALLLGRSPSTTPANVEAALKSTAASPSTRSKDGRSIRRLDVRSY